MTAFSIMAMFLFDLASGYSAGDILRTNISVRNLEPFPIFGATLVIELVHGQADYIYPSELAETDNIFYETVIRGIDLQPGCDRNVPFEYKLPDDLRGGVYRFDTYLGTERSPIVGIPYIYISPKHRSFNVTGSGSFPGIMFVRNLTTFAGRRAQVGSLVGAGQDVAGEIYIACNAPPADNLQLFVSICSWDDTLCVGKEPLWNASYPIGACVNGLANINITLKAPDNPDAYAIRLELKDGERTVSLYRSRIIVSGEAAKIRKMHTDKSYYKAGEEGIISLLISGSPDHYTNPVVRNLKVSAYLLDNEKEVYRLSSTVPELSIDSGLVSLDFRFPVSHDLGNFTVCSEIESSSGVLFDKYCYNVSSSESQVKEPAILADWSYDQKTGSLNVKMCSEGGMAQINASAIVIRKDNGMVDGVKDMLHLMPCADISFQTLGGEISLIATDLKTNSQYWFDLSLPISEPAMAAVCGDGRCDRAAEQMTCCSDCGCPAGSECGAWGCVEKKSEKELNPFYIYAGALFLLLVFVVLFYVLRQKKDHGGDKIK